MSAKVSVHEEQIVQEIKGVPEEYLKVKICKNKIF